MYKPTDVINARMRVAQFYLHRLEDVRQQYRMGGDFLINALQDFDQDWSQIEQSFRWLSANLDDDQVALLCQKLVEVSIEVLKIRLEPAEYVEWLEIGLSISRRFTLPDSMIRFLRGLGGTYRETGQYQAARQVFQEALDIAQTQHDQAAVGRCLVSLGGVCSAQKKFAEAESCLLEGLKILQNTDNIVGLISAHTQLGNLYSRITDRDPAALYRQAIAHLERARVLAAKFNNSYQESIILNNLGTMAFAQEDYPAAQRYYEQSRAVAQDLRDQNGILICNLNLGYVYLEEGLINLAYQTLRDALRQAMSLYLIPIALDALAGIAGIWVQQGRHQAAAELIGTILEHPQINPDIEWGVEMAMEPLSQVMDSDDLNAAIRHGRTLEFSAIVQHIIAN